MHRDGSSRRSSTIIGKPSAEPLCVETQSREIMSVLVHDVVAEAFRLNLYGARAERVEKANGAHLSVREQVKNG